jgi:uncharacterized protein YggE
MEPKIKNSLVVAAVASALVLGFWYVSVLSRSAPAARTFQVSGEGKVIAVPDVVELTLGILTEGGVDLARLQRENSERADRIIAFLKESGIDANDIRTQRYSITPRYQTFRCFDGGVAGGERSCPPPEIVGYTISQHISVKIRTLSKAGDILAGAVERGANSVSGPFFTVDDPKALERRARDEAIAEAERNARAIARAAGFRLGRLVSIAEGVSIPQQGFFERVGIAAGGAAPSIEPGSQEIRVNVTLTYEIR